jgi:hypothetical protein
MDAQARQASTQDIRDACMQYVHIVHMYQLSLALHAFTHTGRRPLADGSALRRRSVPLPLL